MVRKVVCKNKHDRVKRWAVATLCSCCIAYFVLPAILPMCKGLLNIVARRTGFTIGSILITGATRRTATLVTSGLCITQGDNIFKLSTSRIYDNVSAVKWVKSTVVRKKLPNAIIIKIIERVPIAVLQHDHISSLIDENGELIEATGGNQINLPVVLGEEANIKAPAIIMMISKFEALRGKVEVIKFVRKRRWDIVVSGLTVKLPEQDIEHAIEILAKIVLQNNINKDTASYIDLRVHGSVIVRDPKLHRKNGVSV